MSIVCMRLSRRVIQFVALVTLGIGACAFPTPANAQWTCGPQTQQSGLHCKSPIATPWQYYSDLTQVGTHDSLSSLTNAMISFIFAQSGPPKCSVTLDSLTPQGGIGYAWPGVMWSDISRGFSGQFTTVWTNLSPCDVSQTTGIGIHQQRQFTCPAGYIALAQGGDAFCAMDWWKPDPKKPCGSCADGEVNVGGGSGGAGGQGSAGIGSGNNHLQQDDYRGGGGSLGVRRDYNSNHVINYVAIPLNAPPFGPGWSATYFQRIERLGAGSIGGATVHRPDGQTLQFDSSGLNFVSPPDIEDRLVAQRDVSNNIIGWTYTLSNDTVETYDANGKLLNIAYRGGTTDTLQYGAGGSPITVTDSFGNQLIYTLVGGQVSQVQNSAGQIISYQYTDTKLTRVTYPDTTFRIYHYSGYYLTGITDESNTRYSTYAYQAGRIWTTELAGGVSKYTITADSFSRYVTDPLGTQRDYYFDVYALHHLYRLRSASSHSNLVGANKTVTYDANANVSSRKDFNNNTTTYVYDTTRNLETSRTEASGTAKARTITTTWHPTQRLPATITEPNRTTSYTYNAAGRVLTRTVTDTSVTPNVGRTWTYTYNTFGRILTEDGPRTDVSDLTTYTYYTCSTGYQCGQLNTITNAAGHVTTYNAYDVHGRATQMTDSNGLITTMAYDARQRLIDRCVGGDLPSCSGGELTHVDYWPTGLLKKVTTADGSFIEYTYDGAQRLTQINDGAGNKIVYTLDNAGNRTAENTYDPSLNLKRTHSRVFNTLNQLWKDVNAAGTANVTTVYGYDANGNQTTTNAPLSRNSTNLYDELNRLKQITDPNSGITQFGFDANDNLTSVTDPRNLVTSYVYSGFGDLKTQTSPDTGVTSNTYDSGGNLATSTDARGVVTTYGYDALNRVTSSAFALGGVTDQTITYAYDGGTNQKGHLTGASDANHTLSWSYDSHGRVIGKGQQVGAITKAIGYGYNASGQLASIVLPSGKTIQYGYNANNQVTSVTLLGSPNVTILNGVTYDPFGPITGWSWGNGTASTSRTFDTDGKLTQITSAGQRTFAYDDAFRITAANDIADSNKSWTLGYDILDRLNSATKTGTTIGYTYDANGNRLSQTGTSASTYTVSGTSNKLSSTTGALVRSYNYDAVGNTLNSGATVHSFNNANRMKTGRLTGGSDTTYVYNALGQRVKKSGGAIATPIYFVYDEAGHLVGEYDSSGNLIQETVWLGDIPVATLRPNGAAADVFYVHTDQLNTPRKVSRPSDNQLRWCWDPTPFGEGAPNENPASLGTFKYNLRFPGQQFDSETNLNYNYFRDYDSALGRYIQSDPIGLNGGVNTFAYSEGDPLGKSDSRGLNAAGGAAAAAAAVLGIRACMRLPACRKLVQEAIDACMNVRCKFERHRAHHFFPGLGWCEHYSLTCWVKGQKGPPLFRSQWPFPGRCSDTRPGALVIGGSSSTLSDSDVSYSELETED